MGDLAPAPESGRPAHAAVAPRQRGRGRRCPADRPVPYQSWLPLVDRGL